LFGLNVERSIITARIDERTRRMFDRGLLDEVAALADVDGSAADNAFSHTARKLHGLDDCLGVLSGEWSREHALQRMAARTRQYAKRQMTWGRRWPGLIWLEASSGDATRIVADVLDRRAVGD